MEFMEKLLDGVEVEWKRLGELEDMGFVKLGRGNVISKTDLASTPGGFPVYSSSALNNGEFGRYGKYMFDDERITWSVDGGGRFFYREAHKYSVTNVCGWMKVHKQDELNTRFLYYVLSGAWEGKVFDYTKKAHPSVIRDEYEIPIPCPENPKKSLEIQAEIVRILDAFTAMTAELTAELNLRKKQYNYYRDQLLSFEEGEVEWKTLGEIAEIKRGRRLVKSQLEEYGKYAVFQNSMTPLGYYHESNVQADTTFIISAGSAGEIGYSDGGFWAADDVYFFITPEKLKSKFLYYYLLTQQIKLKGQVRRSSVPRLSKTSFEKMPIPVPALEEQARIVAILDKFDALTNSISEGLPREIELRQKQYEYYRDLLLSFPKPEADAAVSI